MRHVLIPLAVLLVGSWAHAGPTEPTIRIKLASGKPITMGPEPRLRTTSAGCSTSMAAYWRLPGTETMVMLDERGRLPRVELRAKKVTVLWDAMPRAVTADVRPDGRMLVVTRDDQEKTCGILELDPTQLPLHRAVISPSTSPSPRARSPASRP
jgi:hypothetical protein